MLHWQAFCFKRALVGLALLAAGLGVAGCQPLPGTVEAGGPTSPPATPAPTGLPATATRSILAPTATASVPPTDTPAVTDTALPPSPTMTASPTAMLLPTPDAEAGARRVRLPILMYHYIEPWPVEADEVRQGLTVRPEDFEAQLAYLHNNGYVAVSLYDLMNALALGTPLPERAVVLTFDDGYRSLMDYAVPIMRKYGYTGTVFVITQLMDEAFPQFLTWEQAEALYAEGWKIEPHTKTHENLAGRGRDFQLYQMLGSMQTVEAHLGVTPRFLAYPAGNYDDLSVQLAGEMHLWGAVTVRAGRVHTFANRMTLERMRVSGVATLTDFIASVEGDPLPTPTVTASPRPTATPTRTP